MVWYGMGWDGMGWDGMGWDGMGWDGMGWDGMGWDGILAFNPDRTGLFDMYKFGGIFTGMDSYSFTSNIKKLQKSNDVIDNDVIILRPLGLSVKKMKIHASPLSMVRFL